MLGDMYYTSLLAVCRDRNERFDDKKNMKAGVPARNHGRGGMLVAGEPWMVLCIGGQHS